MGGMSITILLTGLFEWKHWNILDNLILFYMGGMSITMLLTSLFEWKHWNILGNLILFYMGVFSSFCCC